MTRERILLQHRLGLRRQAVERFAHASGARRQPRPGARRQTVHRSSSITRRRVSEETSPRRRTRVPQPNAISMTPSRSARRGRPSSGAISIGTIAPLSTTAFGNSSRRHLNSWLLFTSWRRATNRHRRTRLQRLRHDRPAQRSPRRAGLHSSGTRCTREGGGAQEHRRGHQPIRAGVGARPSVGRGAEPIGGRTGAPRGQ